MSLESFFSIFKPRDRVFFYHFEASASNVLKMSEDLMHIMASDPGAHRDAILQRLDQSEHANDDLTHTIFTDLARNFITPIDREDIHELATRLDDVADYHPGRGQEAGPLPASIPLTIPARSSRAW